MPKARLGIEQSQATQRQRGCSNNKLRPFRVAAARQFWALLGEPLRGNEWIEQTLKSSSSLLFRLQETSFREFYL